MPEEAERQPNLSSNAAEGQVRPILNYASSATGRMEIIARFPNSLLAYLAAAKLDDEGIAYRLSDQSLLAGIDSTCALSCQESDRAVVIDILGTTPARKYLLVASSDLPPVPAAALPCCSKCSSTEIHRTRPAMRIVAGILAIAWMPFLDPVAGTLWFLVLSIAWMAIWLRNKPWRCRQCGHRWQADSAGAGQKEQT